MRQPEPKKKQKKPRAKRKPPNRKASGKKIEEILVPGVNPKKDDMKNFLEEQRRIWSWDFAELCRLFFKIYFKNK